MRRAHGNLSALLQSVFAIVNSSPSSHHASTKLATIVYLSTCNSSCDEFAANSDSSMSINLKRTLPIGNANVSIWQRDKHGSKVRCATRYLRLHFPVSHFSVARPDSIREDMRQKNGWQENERRDWGVECRSRGLRQKPHAKTHWL